MIRGHGEENMLMEIQKALEVEKLGSKIVHFNSLEGETFYVQVRKTEVQVWTFAGTQKTFRVRRDGRVNVGSVVKCILAGNKALEERRIKQDLEEELV
jgi:hypothetical protein